MKIRYKGILCNLSTYRVMGKDRPALYPVAQSNNETFYKEFDEIRYGLWAKVLTDEEYYEIVDAVIENEFTAKKCKIENMNTEEKQHEKL